MLLHVMLDIDEVQFLIDVLGQDHSSMGLDLKLKLETLAHAVRQGE
jgi:hypothetical protein